VRSKTCVHGFLADAHLVRNAPDLRNCGAAAWEDYSVKLSRPRQLSAIERSILDALLDPEFSGVQALRDQLDGVIVVGRCDCGCPTIDLQASGITLDAASRATWGRTPYEGVVWDHEGEVVGDIILFVDGGNLTSLEYVQHEGLPPEEWPHIESIGVIGPIV